MAGWLGGLMLAAGDGGVHRVALHEVRDAAGQLSGLAVDVRVDGHRLRLLLDTGAANVVMGRRAADRIGLKLGGRTSMVGMSSQAVVGSWKAAGEVRVGSLTLGNVPIRVTEIPPVADVDGLLGANLFDQFLFDLDPGRRTLTLRPVPDEPDERGLPLRRKGHLLFVEAECNDRVTGYALLDTGAAYSAVAEQLAWQVNGPLSADFVPVRGVAGVGTVQRLSPVQFEIGTRKWLDRGPLALNLRAFEDRAGWPVTAVIGFPVLRQSRLRLDFQHATVRFGE
jgi:predicted aspartyl protease